MTRRTAGDEKRGRDDAVEDTDEASLFRRVMADAKPLAIDTVPPPSRTARPTASFTRREHDDVLRESLEGDPRDIEHMAGEIMRYRHPSVGRGTMRRLARGGFSIQGEIDLHGLTVREARAALREFINECAVHRRHCIRIVHGKGRNSGQAGPVLKPMVDRWLRHTDAVLAFVTARPVDGGSGAVIALLRHAD